VPEEEEVSANDEDPQLITPDKLRDSWKKGKMTLI